MFAYNAFCLIIFLFPESTSVYTKYKVLMLHHGVTESSPSGCRQQYFSSGRHLAAAAGVNPGKPPRPTGTSSGSTPAQRPTQLLKFDYFSLLSINDFQFHIQPPLNSRSFHIRILRPVSKTYENSGNTFTSRH